MKKRVTAFILCVGILLTLFANILPPLRAVDLPITVTHQGTPVSNLTVQREEKEVLTAQANGLTDPSYQWQIRIPTAGDLWVNIMDKTQADFEISYAVVQNMLDSANSTYVRCVITAGGAQYVSDPVCVSISFEEPVPEPTVEEPMILLADMAVSTPEATIAPTEEPTAPTEETTAPTDGDIAAATDNEPMAMFSMRRTASSDNGLMTLADDGDGAVEYVTITIKYLDAASENGGEESAIYSPYVATIEKNSPFAQNVVSPTFLGFAPYYDADTTDGDTVADDDASTVALNYATVTDHIVINVYYKPIKVNYAIRYFFQNINDDQYTEKAGLYYTDKAETGTIITNEELQSHAGNTTGFQKMYHIPESVAADGSTVFECYYDRTYYLLQFDLAGGYGVDPLYARYGAPFVINDPVRHGYVFSGWDLLDTDTNGDNKPDKGDGVADLLPSTIPAQNQSYVALWKTVDTTYTTVYWLKNSNGSYSYVGSSIVWEESGTTVSGSDSIDSVKTCEVDGHTHSDANGCYGNCSLLNHTHHVHTSACYNYISGVTDTNIVNNKPDKDAINQANANDPNYASPESGYIYLIQTQTDIDLGRYWPKFVFAGKYYTITINGNGTVTDADLASILVGTETSRATVAGYTAIKYKVKLTCEQIECADGEDCTITEHSHEAPCLTCTIDEHIHNDGCKIDSTYFVYEWADSDVLVEGDGSTVVNVYYKPKEYTLRFYYAATTGNGTDTDGDNVADTFSTVKIIGGSTYSFGKSGTDTSDDATLLNAIFSTTHAGTVKKLPQLNEKGKARNYTLGSLTSGSTSYHYIEFTAGYGQDISDLWPCSVFESATRTSIADNNNGWTGDQAFVSAWNGEHHVWYSQNVGNQTIKGNYEKLDYKLLFDPGYPDETMVSYLCFWENGAGATDLTWNVPELYVYRLWVPVLPGDVANDSATTTVDGKALKTVNGVTYKLIDTYDTCDDSSVGTQTQPSMEGYIAIDSLKGFDGNDTSYDEGTDETDDAITLTDEQKKLYIRGYNVNFFYSRQTNNPFAMKNYGEYIVNIQAEQDGTGGVPYGTKISSLSDLDILGDNFEPSYPSTLEENAYNFEGWYTTEQCLPGTKIDLSTLTMPSTGLILYANWVAETHCARFFTTYDDMLDYVAGDADNSVTLHTERTDILHSHVVGSVSDPTRVDSNGNNLTFGGWFFIENGQKKAFSPLNMPIKKDMNIFADWGSHTAEPYRIEYVLMTDHNTKVADNSTGFAYVGSTRTFTAKAGKPYNQLYEAYNSGYFPTVSSHSITMQYEENDLNPVYNTFTFEYVKADEIEYTVRYVNLETGVELAPLETYTTTDAVVTVRFKAFENMVPDAFYKRLVISVKWDEEHKKWVGTDDNVVTFYYTPNETSAYYAVHYMLEKQGATDADRNNYAIDGTGGYESTGVHEEGIGIVGKTVSVLPQEFPGFELIDNNNVAISVVEGRQTVTKFDGTDYDITISASGTELYIFYRRLSYDYQVHYYLYNTVTPVPTGPGSKEASARYGAVITETAPSVSGYTCVSAREQTLTVRDKAEQNVIIFYYAPIQYVAEYVPVPDEGGWMSQTIEVISGNQELTGSIPNANPNYRFAGWYLDQACTQPVTGEYGTIDTATNHFIPDKNKLSETERNIFYAKFDLMAGDLIIRRAGAETDQVFVYAVTHNESGETITVTATGNQSVTIHGLPFGTYSVTPQNSWSWRYNDAAQNAVAHQADVTEVSFGSAWLTQWLNGNSELHQNVKGG